LAFHSEREADHSPPSSAEVKEWVELCLHPSMRLHGVVLSWGEHRGNFTFTLPRFIHRSRNFSSTYSVNIPSKIL
jgi:hypothetical protein